MQDPRDTADDSDGVLLLVGVAFAIVCILFYLNIEVLYYFI